MKPGKRRLNDVGSICTGMLIEWCLIWESSMKWDARRVKMPAPGICLFVASQITREV